MQVWKDYQEKNKERFLEELLQLLRIPSISAKKENKKDLVNCAEAVKERLLQAGADKADRRICLHVRQPEKDALQRVEIQRPTQQHQDSDSDCDPATRTSQPLQYSNSRFCFIHDGKLSAAPTVAA